MDAEGVRDVVEVELLETNRKLEGDEHTCCDEHPEVEPRADVEGVLGLEVDGVGYDLLQ